MPAQPAPAAGRGAPSPAALDTMLDQLDPPQVIADALADLPPELDEPARPLEPAALAYLLGAGAEHQSEHEEHETMDQAVGVANGFLPPLLAQALVVQRLFPRLMLVDLLVGAVMREVGPVGKSQLYEGSGTRYNFRGIDDVVNATAAAIRKSGLWIRPLEVERTIRDAMTTRNAPTREATATVTYRIQAPDDTYRDVVVPGESLDQSDKGSAKAMSVALRICLLQTLHLPTTEPDPDSQYLTREGHAGFSPTTAQLMYRTITTAPLELVLTEAVAAVREHAAWERPSVTEQTWAEVLTARIVGDIAALPGVDAAKVLAGLLKQHGAEGWRSGDVTMLGMLRARWTELAEVARKTHDHCMQLVLDAFGQDEIDAALDHVDADAEHGGLPLAQAGELRALAAERRAKLPEVAPEPDEAPCDEKAVHEPHVDVVRSPAPRNEAHRFRCQGVTESQAAGEEPAAEPAADPWAVVHPEHQPEEPAGETVPVQAETLEHFRERVAAAIVAAPDLEGGARSGAITVELTRLLRDTERGPRAAAFGMEGLVAVEDAIKAAHRRDKVINDQAREYLDGTMVKAYEDFAAEQEAIVAAEPLDD